MKAAPGWIRMVVLGLVVALAAGAAHGCGTSSRKRERGRCEACDPNQIDHECVSQCRDFCVPDDATCTARCNRECDRCKAELECRTCSSDCTGTVARCAAVGEPLTCEDGVF